VSAPGLPVRAAAAALLFAALAACAAGPPPALPEPERAPEPPPAEVERVLFLLGDPGEVTTATSPLLQRLGRDVESWSGALAADSAVAIVVLGDIIYPDGLHAPETEVFARDTAVVMSQVRLVTGPQARARGARVYFVAGNHDWGQRKDFEGAVRLARLAAFLESVRQETGAHVELVPEAGTGGPFVWDWGPHVRLLLLDTAWWLLGADDAEETAFLARVEEAMRTAGERQVLFGAHHPFRSAGPHGGEISVWKMLGLYYLLQRAGALLQDLTSRPYRELERGLRGIFSRTGPPFAFIGGHEHSLQVFERVEPTDPAYSLVSGSGSKLSSVGMQPGLRFAERAPGYMRLLVRTDGAMHLSVEATGEAYLACDGEPEAAAECVAAGLAAFETVHSQPLR
jgi:hypothetical protein